MSFFHSSSFFLRRSLSPASSLSSRLRCLISSFLFFSFRSWLSRLPFHFPFDSVVISMHLTHISQLRSLCAFWNGRIVRSLFFLSSLFRERLWWRYCNSLPFSSSCCRSCWTWPNLLTPFPCALVDTNASRLPACCVSIVIMVVPSFSWHDSFVVDSCGLVLSQCRFVSLHVHHPTILRRFPISSAEVQQPKWFFQRNTGTLRRRRKGDRKKSLVPPSSNQPKRMGRGWTKERKEETKMANTRSGHSIGNEE